VNQEEIQRVLNQDINADKDKVKAKDIKLDRIFKEKDIEKYYKESDLV
jgi:hypothetical protein